MKNKISLTLLVVVALVGLGCGDGPTSASVPSLDGSWTRLEEVPGSGETWNLTLADTLVTGNGNWSGEACCSGTLTISGHVSRDSLHLDLTFTTIGGNARPPFHEHFDGVLLSPTLLEGSASVEHQPGGTVHLRKGTPTPSVL